MEDLEDVRRVLIGQKVIRGDKRSEWNEKRTRINASGNVSRIFLKRTGIVWMAAVVLQVYLECLGNCVVLVSALSVYRVSGGLQKCCE